MSSSTRAAFYRAPAHFQADGADGSLRHIGTGLFVAAAALAEAARKSPPTTTLTVATFPDLDRAVRAALPRWNQQHPQVAIKLVSLQYAEHHAAMASALANGSGLPDVMALDFRFIGRFAEGGGLHDLLQAPYDAGPLRDRFVRFAVPQATSSRGEWVALPADIGPGTLLYRKDLLDRAGVDEAELTRDWDSYLQAGRKIKARTGAHLLADAADLRDIVLRSGLQDGEGLYFDRTGRVLVDSPRFVEAFELGRAVRQAGIDARALAWTNEWAAGLTQNRIATQMMGAWLTGHLKHRLAPDTTGLWRAAALPGGALASYGGSFYAIARQAAHPAEAWQFIQFMTLDPQTQLDALRELDSFPALAEAHDALLMDEPLPFLGGQKARRLWRDTAARMPSLPVNPNDVLATDLIRDAFDRVLDQGQDIGAALGQVKARLERHAGR